MKRSTKVQILGCLTAFTVSFITTISLESHKPVDNIVNNVNNTVDKGEFWKDAVHVLAPTPVPYYSDKDLSILAMIIYQEVGADYCSDDTRRKVGSVFINRVNSDYFPDTFEEVALQKRQYGELYWTGLKWPDRASLKQERHAVKRAYRIAKEILEEGSILPDDVLYQAEFPQGVRTHSYQDGMYFCYLGGNK